ncbi:techylectin-5A [Parasteatoda tepidariorum]|uniref:techylectin-5A n=1 Tax=Parasteatoda tepidariorum TaxID=114398 RepID=UPI001C728CE2|nr:techylectin-5A [Parasteatoda tepidariorum]
MELYLLLLSAVLMTVCDCNNYFERSAISKTNCPKPIDCEGWLLNGYNKSGTYTIWPRNRVLQVESLDVFCDMDTDGGGWTVIQRRGNYSRPKDYFYKNWSSYKSGFGDIEKDFWLGNDNIFALTNQKLYSARFDLKDIRHAKRYALYDKFWTDDEAHNYTLHIEDYTGDAGDAMKTHNNMQFSTKDVKNDLNGKDSCAHIFRGGWWYNACHNANLNGLYLPGEHPSYADGVSWIIWKGGHESLASAEIKIRSKNFRKRRVAFECNN